MRYIGIDPGMTGAIAGILVSPGTPDILAIRDMPLLADRSFIDVVQLAALLGKGIPTAIHLEAPSPMGTDGRGSLGNFMQVFGAIRAVVMMSGHPYTLSHPSTWKKRMGLTVSNIKEMTVQAKKKIGKQMAHDMALELYPNAQKHIYLKKHHDRAEALLLAHDMRRALEQQT